MKLVLILIHVIVCVSLIMIVLLQKGKGAGMGAAFGGSSQTVFGSSGAGSFLTKVTTAAAIVFMLTSLRLSFFFGKGRTTSVMEGVPVTEVPAATSTQNPAPAAPAPEQPASE